MKEDSDRFPAFFNPSSPLREAVNTRMRNPALINTRTKQLPLKTPVLMISVDSETPP